MQLPCGGCIGCRKAKAQAWTLRCLLELQKHKTASFTNLTYDEHKVPPTLSRRDITLFYKRLRRHTTKSLRHFTSGEYGEQNGRPHYHAIIYGLDPVTDKAIMDMAWAQGRTRHYPVTPHDIAYVAGYVAKKYAVAPPRNTEFVDYNTGEIFEWQPPFIQPSRGGRGGHGIGGHAREHVASWRDFAILNGAKIPVPRYLHQAWRDLATAEQIEQLEYEKAEKRAMNKETRTEYHLNAAEKQAIAQQQLQAQKRKL